MKINLGGGLKRFDGFLNVDHDPLTNPDFCFDIEKDKFPFDDNSIEEVKAHHILEHIGDKFFNFMKELYRVCKNGAIIDIFVPHHRHENYFNDPTHRRPITVEMLKQFSKKWCEWHQDYWKSSSGFAPRLNVDFEITTFEYLVDYEYEEMAKQGRQEEIFELAKRFNNVFFETKIKLVVIKS
jgi:ubiquinone/menaquinone biosynthesis C-methylase UbiE